MAMELMDNFIGYSVTMKKGYVPLADLERITGWGHLCVLLVCTFEVLYE